MKPLKNLMFEGSVHMHLCGVSHHPGYHYSNCINFVDCTNTWLGFCKALLQSASALCSCTLDNLVLQRTVLRRSLVCAIEAVT